MKKLGKHGGRLIVRNLPFGFTEKQIRKTFGALGTLKEVNLPWDEAKKRNKGFVFLEYEKKNISVKALAEFNGKKIQNRQIAVDWALSKEVYAQTVKKEEQDEQFKPQESDKPATDPEQNSDAEPQEASQPQDSEKPKEAEENGKKRNVLYEGCTLFVTNLSYSTEEEDLHEYFSEFGKLRYATIVYNKETGDSKGEGFVCYLKKEDADTAMLKLKEAGEDMELDGRVPRALVAVSREQASTLKKPKPVKEDKRNLYLKREGLILPGSKDYENLTEKDIEKRISAARLKREKLKNPNVFISKTRLMIRNIPKSVDEKRLKKIAKRYLEKNFEDLNKKKLFKQIKVMREKDRVDKNGNLRSKGFAFIECEEHDHAKALLNHLNNNTSVFGPNNKPIVEFSLEDHRKLRLKKLKEDRRQKAIQDSKKKKAEEARAGVEKPKKMGRGQKQRMKKRMMKEQGITEAPAEAVSTTAPSTATQPNSEPKNRKDRKDRKNRKEKEDNKKIAETELPKKRTKKEKLEFEVLEFDEPRPRKRRKKEDDSKIEQVIADYRTKLFSTLNPNNI